MKNGQITRKNAHVPAAYSLQRSILGDNFIPPESIEAIFCTTYSEGRMPLFPFELKNRKKLEKLALHDLVVLPTPPHHVNFRTLVLELAQNGHELEAPPKLLSSHCFHHEYLVPGRWIICDKVGGKGNEGAGSSAPNCCLSLVTAFWFLTAFYLVRGKRLFPKNSFATTSLCDDGLSIRIGLFRKEGIWVGTHEHTFNIKIAK